MKKTIKFEKWGSRDAHCFGLHDSVLYLVSYDKKYLSAGGKNLKINLIKHLKYAIN